MVYKLFQSFRSGHNNESDTIIIKIHDLVMSDKKLKGSEIASTVGISNERAQNILQRLKK